MKFDRVLFRVHALQRMFEREVSSKEGLNILENGEVIEEYPGDDPFASSLLLGRSENRSLHVVVAFDKENTAIVITVYEPDPEQWEDGFRRRRKR